MRTALVFDDIEGYVRAMLDAAGWAVRVAEVALRLTRRGDVFRTRLFENLFALAHPRVVVCVHRQQNPAFPHPPLVPLRLVLRDAQSDRSEERRVGKECRSRWS